ncbi:MAG: hypothetical protein IKF71_05495 [Bacilli bacterium]|nr:hypothetical protein [Bacilli bacterium]
MIFVSIFSLWLIGRFLKEKESSCGNIHQVCSNYLSYYYGNSFCYSLSQIRKMKQFYLYFPIFIECMNQIRWSSYLELLKLPSKECYFYYSLLLFCGDDLLELKRLIYSDLYMRI